MTTTSTHHASVAYRTDNGFLLQATVEEALRSSLLEAYAGEVKLIFTSPPFPLKRKKKYGNRTGSQYLEWLQSLAKPLTELLAPDGSIVMEIGNAWEPGHPVMSTLPLRSLLAFLDAGELNLCQQFVCHNPARLPSPAQWVTIERIRVKDSFTHVWWMAPSERPHADNSEVLVEYSSAMKRLLKKQTYNAGSRPSGHNVSEDGFLTNNGGAIPPSMLEFANTTSRDVYRQYCRERNIPIHPARMQPGLAEFFIRMLTQENDLVLDPFAGSNTTGAVAESLNREWICIEPMEDYVKGSLGRFEEPVEV